MNIKAVAEKAGVSVATISRVLNHPDMVSEKTKEHILAVMKELDYMPNWFARNLHMNKTSLIGLLIPDFLDPCYMELAKGVEDVAHQKKYNIMLCNTEGAVEKEKEYIETFISRKVDGLILVSTLLTEEDLQQIKKRDISIILIEKRDFLHNVDVVYTNYKEASEEAMAHILEMNYREIAFIYGRQPKLENLKKLEGYKNALQMAGVEFNEEYVEEEDNTIEGGYLAAAKLLELKRPPRAIFVASDMMAFGVMDRIKREGLSIPRDVAIVGFDNLRVSAIMEPQLTTIATPMYRMGLVGTRLLFDLMEGERDSNRATQDILIESRLKVRRSCGHKDRLKEIL